MGIMSEIKSTYSFTKKELKKDIKRSPTLSNAYKKSKKIVCKAKPKNIKISKLKGGKSISTEQALSKLKKGVPKSKYSKVKYKKKKISELKRDNFSLSLNI